MSEPLTREQVERAYIGLLGDVAIKGKIGLTTTLVLLSAHDAALQQQFADMTDEVRHYREAAASVGETDGHGWAETTKELRQQLVEATERAEAAETSVAFDKVTCLMMRNRGLEEQLAKAQARAHTQRDILTSLVTVVGEMKVPQTMAAAALQIFIVGPILKRAQDFLSKETDHAV